MGNMQQGPLELEIEASFTCDQFEELIRTVEEQVGNFRVTMMGMNPLDYSKLRKAFGRDERLIPVSTSGPDAQNAPRAEFEASSISAPIYVSKEVPLGFIYMRCDPRFDNWFSILGPDPVNAWLDSSDSVLGEAIVKLVGCSGLPRDPCQR